MAFCRRALKLVRLLFHSTFRTGLRYGVAASLENRPVMRSLQVRSVIDAGANVGQFALLMRHFHRDAVIHAFEPFPSSAAIFARLFAQDRCVHLHRHALGMAAVEADLHVSRRADSSSLLPISSSQTVFAPGTEEVGVLTVPVRRLDDVLSSADLPRPSLLKIDVQGGELDVLKGAEGLLPHLDYIYVEVSFAQFYQGQPLANEVIDHLQARGYCLTGIGGTAQDRQGLIVQADLLFSRLQNQ
ncbi:FkbM family methyltransferase [Niveispirillum lacus]|nr:FkbM family methyltransferase [Niveispirillum lacus]